MIDYGIGRVVSFLDTHQRKYIVFQLFSIDVPMKFDPKNVYLLLI